MKNLLEKTRKILLSDCAAIFYTACLTCLLAEIIGHKDPIDGIVNILTSPHIFFFNTLIFTFTYAIALFFKRRIFVCSVIAALWLTLTITNCVLIHIRGNPLTAVDFTIFTDGIAVMPAYLSPLMILLIIAAFAAGGAAVAALFIKAPKFKVYPVRAVSFTVGIAALFTAMFISFLSFGVVERKYDDLLEGYSDDGFAYCFALSAFDTGIDQPTDYSKKSVSDLLDVLLPSGEEPKQTPNVIFYQLESFFDLSRVEGVETSENTIPNFTRLRDEGKGGKLFVSTIGGGTANTEFEVLTGIDLSMFGLGEYPYTTVLKDSTCSTVCYDLEKYGYKSYAIHNHSGSFYGRNEVFERLGFDVFSSIEYMQGEIKRTPADWAMDDVVLREIKTVLESEDSPAFVFAITVEGHGKYPGDVEWPSSHITVSAEGKNNAEYEYYANMAYDADRVLGELIAYVDSLDEPTVLVAYGDHLPALEFSESDLTDGNIYMSEYVVYSNTDGFDTGLGDIEAYQLYPRVLDEIGIEGGVVCRLNNRLFGENGFKAAMQTIAYDILYGERQTFDGAAPTKDGSMKMGLYDIVIKEAYIADGVLHVKGENFTEYSTIYIGPWKQDTEFISPNHITCADTWAFLSNSVYVAQVSSDLEKLSVTENYIIDQTQ